MSHYMVEIIPLKPYLMGRERLCSMLGPGALSHSTFGKSASKASFVLLSLIEVRLWPGCHLRLALTITKLLVNL
jgi:hypothetical protein